MALKNNTKGFLLTVGCLLWLSQWLMGSTVILKSDQLFFDEAINVVEAEGNVELKTNGFSIKASALSFHLDNALVTSKESVQITRGDENFNSSSLVLDLEQSQLKLEDIHIAMELPNKKGKVYVNVRELIDKSNRKMGTNARITTCPLNEPHHYLRAWKMNYQPGKRVDLFFAYWMNHYTFFPFTILPPVPVLEWLPVPFYSYHLGQRNIIWNFPTIGKKTTDGWGWFVQNTIDFRYENNKESSILLDWFETKGDRKGNIGAGLNLNLGNYDHYSTIYYYNYDFEQGSEKKQNRIYAFSQTFTFDQWLMTAKYKRLDVDERINSSGSDSYEEWSMNTTLDPNGFPLKMSLKDKSQFKQNYTSFSSSASKQGLHYTSQLSYNDNVYKSSDRQSVSSKLTHSYELKHGINVSHTFDYRKDDDTDDNIAADENLKTYTSINKRLPKDIHMRIKLDYFIDVDSDRVTNDLQSQNFLYRLPEVELSKKGELFSFKSDSLFRFGWYKEYRYSSALDELEEISLDDKSFQPNVYFFSQKFSKDVSNLPYKSRFNFNTAYEQYVFKNENKTIFEGDAQYNIAINGSLSSDINNWVRMSTNYKSRYAPEENNSPFYAFNKNVYEVNEITEKIAFYYERPKSWFFQRHLYLEWSHAAGYNWLSDSKPWNDYKTAITMKVDKRSQLKISTAQRLNAVAETDKYSPLVVDLDLRTKQQFNLDYLIIYDMNDIVFNDAWSVNRSSINCSFPLGKEKDYAWHFNIYMTYNSEGIGQRFDPSYYDLRSISIKKQEHVRTLELGYKKQAEELYFKYTFKLFPNDPIELRRRNDVWTFEGRLKSGSKERFK